MMATSLNKPHCEYLTDFKRMINNAASNLTNYVMLSFKKAKFFTNLSGVVL